MTTLLLALALGAIPEVWVAAHGLTADGCDASALASAVRAERPGMIVRAWSPDAGIEAPPEGALRVSLAAGAGGASLEITGVGPVIRRSLPPEDTCERQVRIAALIVDGALDDLHLSRSAPQVSSLAVSAPVRHEVVAGVLAGAGVEQGAGGWVASFDLGGQARYRWFELTLDADLALPATTAFNVQAPETGSGSISVTALGIEGGGGFTPRVGPGRASLDVVVVGALAFGSASASSAGELFQSSSGRSGASFAGVRVGYLFELPAGLMVGVRLEERGAFSRQTFSVDGADHAATTPAWAFRAVGLVGVRFF